MCTFYNWGLLFSLAAQLNAFLYANVQVHLAHQVFEYKVSPDVCLMKKILHQLKKKDAADIFADPVPLDDVSCF